MLLHGIFLLGIFSADGINLWLQYAHLSTTQVTLLVRGINQQLNNNGKQQQDNTHVHAKAGEPMEEGHDEPAVDITEDEPAQINDVFQFGVLVGLAKFVVCLQGMELVGAQIHLQFGRLIARGVEEGLHLSLVSLQVAILLLCFLRGGKMGIREVLRSNKYGAEELVPESYPVEGFLGIFCFIAGLAQFLCTFILALIG